MPHPAPAPPSLIVVMGVSGCGKTTIGARLAQRCRVPFCEGDALHPAANLAKMAAGKPLDHEDRAPWLDRVNQWMRDHQAGGGVVACSALRRRYRDRLACGLVEPPAWVLLDPPPGVLAARLATRRGHFMPVALLDSQLATLERPAADERALHLTGGEDPEALVEDIVGWLDAEEAPQ